MARDHGRRRRRRVERRRSHAHHRLGARLDGMAGQCLRGRPEAAQGSLHHGTPGAPHHGNHTHTSQPPEVAQQAQERARQGIKSEAIGDGENRGETTHRSTRRGSSHRFQLEEVVEGVGATVLPQASVAEAIGVGQNGRSMAAAI
jgi:hypothetical protein